MSSRPLRQLAAFVALVPALAPASTVFEQTLGERTRAADRVVLAQVLDSRTEVAGWTPARREGGKPTPRMFTVTRVAVGTDLKGGGAAQLELVQLGGRTGLWEAHVPGDASFTSGEQAVLFLRCRDRARPERCALVGLGAGKVPVVGNDAVLSSLARPERTRRPLREVAAEVRAASKETR